MGQTGGQPSNTDYILQLVTTVPPVVIGCRQGGTSTFLMDRTHREERAHHLGARLGGSARARIINREGLREE